MLRELAEVALFSKTVKNDQIPLQPIELFWNLKNLAVSL